MKLLGGLKKGLIFIISAPAGTGKTTLARMLCQEFPCVVESISYTTRPQRSNEVNGRDYQFIPLAEFEQKIAENEFLEYANVFGDFYGTSRRYVEEQQLQGKHVLLVIDTQGAMQLKNTLDAVFIFISPPHFDELQRRLHNRKSENSAAIEQRLSWAEREMATASRYDYHIVNDHLETAYAVLRSILIAEEHRTKQNH